MRIITTVLLAVLLCLVYGNICLAVTVSAAGIGTPGCNPGTAIICPTGDMGAIQVTATEAAGYPVGTRITCTAAGPLICFCPGQNPQTQVVPVGNPVVNFTYFREGGCGNVTFSVVSTFSGAAGPTPPIFVASPDINGDCQVNLIDFVQFAQCFLGANPCCDFNCDGTVNLTDFITFATHYLHFC
ncbi:MAG: hypothetical protein ABIJ00_11340 [Candidatus Eisenbacteria bacterium]